MNILLGDLLPVTFSVALIGGPSQDHWDTVEQDRWDTVELYRQIELLSSKRGYGAADYTLLLTALN